MKTSYETFIGKPEISFWVPVIFTAVSISTSFLMLSSRVDMLGQRIEQVIANQEIITSKYENVQVRLGTVERQISVLSERLSFKLGGD